MKWIIILLNFWLFAGCASAQQIAKDPPCSSEEHSQFDFWLGTWDVADHKGVLVGRNVITKEENGCLIVERWTSANGGTGQSYNFYDPKTRQWRQIWVGAGSVIEYSGQSKNPGSMKLEGEIRYQTGGVFPFTGEWSLQEDGTVRQYFEQYDPEADVWKPWFTGFYTKVDLE